MLKQVQHVKSDFWNFFQLLVSYKKNKLED